MSAEFNFKLPLSHSTPYAKKPERQNYVPLSKFGWYRVLVYSSSNDCGSSMEEMLEQLYNSFQCLALPLTPYYLHEGGEPDEPNDAKASFTFYVKRFGLAMALQNLRFPGEQKLRVRVNNRLPRVRITLGYKQRLRLALLSRYDAVKRCLDLNSFHCDAQWEDEFCALAQHECLKAAFAEIIECVPELRRLVLDGNYLRNLTAFIDIERYLPQLQTISLQDNELNSLESLRVFAQLPLKELTLRRNLIKLNMQNLCQLFPKLCVLDNRSIKKFQQPVGEFVKKTNILEPNLLKEPLKSSTMNLPAFKRTYLVEPQASADLHVFLKEYLSTFDGSIERLALESYYQKNALVSLSIAQDAFAGWFAPYKIYDNNSLSKCVKIFELEASSAAALAMFSCWPRTLHLLHTLTVDLLVRQPQRVCFTITGLFEEHLALSAQPPLLRYFMRTFVLVPLANSCPPDFRIANEQIYLCAASRAQRQQLRSKATPTPLSNSAYFQNVIKRHMPKSSQQEQQQQLQQQTHMHMDWCRKCLTEWNWNYQQALDAFKTLQEQQLIPREAFL